MKNNKLTAAEILRAKADLIDYIESKISNFEENEENIGYNEEYLKQEGISEYSTQAYTTEIAQYNQKIAWYKQIISYLIKLD